MQDAAGTCASCATRLILCIILRAKRNTVANISEKLLAVLRCPVTGSTLVQDGGELVSTANGPAGVPLRYTIDEGIALLLRPEQITS